MRFIVNDKISQAYTYDNVMKYEEVLKEFRQVLATPENSVSEAYTYDNVAKYEEVLKELRFVLLQKRVAVINQWADEHLNTYTKTTE